MRQLKLKQYCFPLGALREGVFALGGWTGGKRGSWVSGADGRG